ncbi:ABC transporter permease [Fulvivirgaceae bacterium PWU5]|uniref:ABC transporter permease n=1 Tax=Dawidia cretensis TaxID=2782350 RepID=A0AAP2E0R9_9BACT|nr:ABC transporter permease [Dawidia cretensis]MBT1709522.1 ABC transporter permease [Dawidia cretensis]
MLTHHFRLAIRNFLRNRTFILINVLSLTFAFTCCILSYINYEYSNDFNVTHVNTDNVHRINMLREDEGKEESMGVVPLALPQIVNDDPENVTITRLTQSTGAVNANGKVFNETVHFVDKSFFTTFTMPLKYGSLSAIDKNKILISQEVARKYFGETSVMGKEMMVKTDVHELLFEVGGVLEDAPKNSSFQLGVVAMFENYLPLADAAISWKSPNLLTTFVHFNEANRVTQFKEKLKIQASDYNAAQERIKVKEFYLQPFRELAVTSDVDMPNYVSGSPLKTNPKGVIVIGPIVFSILILLISCFNFFNTTIAIAGQRLKEIGIRKVLGSRQGQLILQFVGENLLLCLITVCLSVACAELLLPVLNQSLLTQLSIGYFDHSIFFIVLFALTFVTAIIAGLYPAYFISSFDTLTVLKGRAKFSSGSINVILLTVQFIVATFALVIGVVMVQNSAYQENSPMGYDMHMVSVTKVDTQDQYHALYNAVRQHPKVLGVSGSPNQMGEGEGAHVAIHYNNRVEQGDLLNVGHDYLSMMGITLESGRFFDDKKESDYKTSILINKTLAQHLDISQAADQTIAIEGHSYNLIGIITDYRENGNHGVIPAMIFKAGKDSTYRYFSVKAEQDQLEEVNAYVIAQWKELFPDQPYNGYLQKDVIEKEVRLSDGFKTVSLSLAVITILLSAGGLYSLVSLNILRRMKEIAIRKVLGSSIGSIIAFMSKGLFRILIVSSVLGSLLAFVVVDKLIFKFIYAYHTDLSIFAFAMGCGLIALAVAFITGSKIYKAANTNPVVVLKNE